MDIQEGSFYGAKTLILLIVLEDQLHFSCCSLSSLRCSPWFWSSIKYATVKFIYMNSIRIQWNVHETACWFISLSTRRRLWMFPALTNLFANPFDFLKSPSQWIIIQKKREKQRKKKENNNNNKKNVEGSWFECPHLILFKKNSIIVKEELLFNYFMISRRKVLKGHCRNIQSNKN